MLPCTEPRDCSRQVIGYSDGRDFAVGVGPKPAGPAEGLFANLVQPVIVRKPSASDAAGPASPTADVAKSTPGAKKLAGPSIEPKSRAPIVQPLAGRRALLYDWLPPAKGEKNREGSGGSSEASKAYRVSMKENEAKGEGEGEVAAGRDGRGVPSEASKAYRVSLKEKEAERGGEEEEGREDAGGLVENENPLVKVGERSREKDPSLGHATEEDMFAEAGAGD
jgi:hypothetical protein